VDAEYQDQISYMIVFRTLGIQKIHYMNRLKSILLFLVLVFTSNFILAQCPGSPPLAFTFESTESRCESNGTITLHIEGGTPFTDAGGNPIYNNTIIAPIVTPIGGQSDSMFAALVADTYTVEVKDANGCSVTHQVVVPGTHMQLEFEIEFEDAICDGTGGGWICGTAAEGRPFPPGYYEYQLFDASTTPPTPLGPRGLDSCFTNLATGSYQIRAFDSCQNFQTRDVIIGVKQYSSGYTIWKNQSVVSCTKRCFYFDPRESSGGLPPEYPVTWEVTSSTDPDILGRTGIVNQRFDGDTICWDPIYQTGGFVFTCTDACGVVETVYQPFSNFSIFAPVGYSCQDGNTLLFYPQDYCANSTWTYESVQVPPGAAPIAPQSDPYITNLESGTYCFRVSDCCGNVTTVCRDFQGPIWTADVFDSYEFACEIGDISFETEYHAPNNSPQPTGDENYILTSAPIGYPNAIPDTFKRRELVIGPAGTYCFTLEDECLRTHDSCFIMNNPFDYDYSVQITEGCVTGNSIEINYLQTGGINNQNIKVDFEQIAPVSNTIQYNTLNFSWFNLSAGTYVSEIRNNGNNNKNCVIKRDTFVISPYTTPSISGAWGIECDNGVGLITVQGAGGNTPYTYELFQGPVTRPLQSSPTFPGLPIGTYDIRMFDNCGNSETTTESIETFMPVIQGYNGTACLGDSLILYVDYFDFATYSWTGPNGATSDTSVLIIPNVSAADAGTFTVDIDVKNPDQTACIAQTLTVEASVLNCNCPDLTPTITILPGNISGVSQVGVAIEITELNGVDTDGSTITVRVPSDPRLTFNWNPGLTFVALTQVNNNNWNYLGDNGFVHTFTYNGTGQQIAGSTTESFGMVTTYDPQNTDGQTTITATIVPFSGGECKIVNNTDPELLVYFE